MDHKPNFSGFLQCTYELFRSNVLATGLYTLVAAAIYVGMGFVTDAVYDADYGGYFKSLLAGFIVLLGLTILSAVPLYLYTRILLDRIGALTPGGNRLAPYLIMTIITLVGYAFGAVLLLVPMIALMVRWMASGGYVVGEGLGASDSLSASWEATRGYSWSIFGLGLLIWLPTSLIEFWINSVSETEIIATLSWLNLISCFANAVTSAGVCAFGVAVFYLTSPNKYWAAQVFE